MVNDVQLSNILSQHPSLNPVSGNTEGTVVRLVNSIETLRNAISSNRWNGYYVLTQDIILTEAQTEALIITDSNKAGYADSSEHVSGTKYLAYVSLRGTLDGLGHTISYTINDSTMSGGWSGLFHNLRGGSKIMNLNVKADVTRKYTVQDSSEFNCLLAEVNYGANIIGCYFDMKLTTTQDTTVDFTRTCVIKNGQLEENSEISAIMKNCVINVRSYTYSGTLRENSGSSGQCEGKAVGEGSTVNLVNCAYISNTTTGNKTMGGTNVSSTVYSYISTFVTAWTNDTLQNKDGFEKYGFTVSGTTLKFWDVAIN